MRRVETEFELPGIVAPPRRIRAKLRPEDPQTRFRRALAALAPTGFGYICAAADAAAILGAAYVSRTLYGLATLGLLHDVEPVTSVGVIVALLLALSTIQRGGYDLEPYLAPSGLISRAFLLWNFAFLGAFALGFATKTTSEFSRGAVVVFYFSGFASLALGRRALANLAAWMRQTRLAPARRMVAIGLEDSLTTLLRNHGDHPRAAEIVSLIALRDNQAFFTDDLELATAAVRMYRPDEVFLAIPWSRPAMIEACVDALIRTPAQIQLGADRVLDRFGEVRVSRLGDRIGVELTRPPLTRLQQLEKRAFDIVVAAAALIVLAPLFAIVGLLIRLDSAGPALFRQKRYGFNQEPFRIYKFRSMTTMEDDANVAQAKRADPRVTRVGAFLRRTSLDELPQLFNVLIGDMSIVGPRPHALAHDQRYVERLARYARRHNVKPGITGWAQVWGHRGEILNDQQMQLRLEHDLHYIDNWSLWLDLKIMLLTALSGRAHKNAY